MNLSLNLLVERLKLDYPGICVLGNGRHKVHHIEFYDPDTFQADTEVLYLVMNKTLPAKADNTCWLLLDSEELAVDPVKVHILPNNSDGILVPEGNNLFAIFNSLTQVFGAFANWKQKVTEAIFKNKTISEILTLCNLVTPDTVWMSDSSLKMLGYSTPTLMEEVSAIWHYQVTYGYMPMHIVKHLIESGELNRLSNMRTAFVCNTESFNLPYTCKNIFHKGKLWAHIFFVSIYSKPTHTNLEMAEVLAGMLTPYLERHRHLVESSSFHSSYFLDILERRLTDEHLISQQLSYFHWNMNDRYVLVTFDPAGDFDRAGELRLSLLNDPRKPDCQFFSNDTYLFGLFHNLDSKTLEDLLIPLVEHGKIHCVISKPFFHLGHLPESFESSLKGLKVGMQFTPDRYLYYNEEYGLYSIIQQLLMERPITDLCHDAVLNLCDLDRTRGTDYVETLYQYISNDRNVLKTAKAMYIHRNTLNYRLKHIAEYIDVENAAPEVLHYVLFSIYVLKYA